MFDAFAAGRLTWWPQIGVGYYPVAAGTAPYDASYLDNYAQRAQTGIGRALMAARVSFVAQFWAGALVDVGVGSGAFIEARQARGAALTYGYDVNPLAVEWLQARGLWLDPYAPGRVPAASFWDSLEHIPDFPALLGKIASWVFMSLPIFADAAHVLRSKHFKPDEHVWYFTASGLIDTMRDLGFACVAQNTMETAIGREDIGSFAFRRI